MDLSKLKIGQSLLLAAKLPSVSKAKALSSKLAKAAQEVYDDWSQDEKGYDSEVGYGGICHLIVDKMLPILDKAGIECSSVSSSHEQHVYIAAKFSEGVFTIDVPHSIYEKGGGFTWKKIPGIKFDSSDIVFRKVDSDPESFESYIEPY